jgi:chromatin remodeling complex protein RSC6
MAAKKKGKKGGKKGGKKPAKKAAKKKGRKPNAAFMRPVTPNDKLAAIVGASPLPRTELTKKLWVYIKKNGLQDKKNRRMINADDKMRALFGGKASASMFELTKYASKNLK